MGTAARGGLSRHAESVDERVTAYEVTEGQGVSVEIELFGGPAHGMRVVIEGDPMNPPHTYELLHPPTWRELEDADPETPVEPRRLTYRREVNPGDAGPLWVYRYEGTQ